MFSRMTSGIWRRRGRTSASRSCANTRRAYSSAETPCACAFSIERRLLVFRKFYGQAHDSHSRLTRSVYAKHCQHATERLTATTLSAFLAARRRFSHISRIRIEPLSGDHDRSGFVCGSDALDLERVATSIYVIEFEQKFCHDVGSHISRSRHRRISSDASQHVLWRSTLRPRTLPATIRSRPYV